MNCFDSSGLNQNLLGGGVPVNLTGFSPVVTAAVTWGTSIVFTDATVVPSGDTFKHINISITDNQGVTVLGSITSASGTATIATTTLQQTGVYQIKVDVNTLLGCTGDGYLAITKADTTGTLAQYSIGFTTAGY